MVRSSRSRFQRTCGMRFSPRRSPLASTVLLSECDHVALVIDNRPDKADELMEVEAVTATGRSQLIERGASSTGWPSC